MMLGIAPCSTAPKKAAASASECCRMRITTSPGRTPAAANCAAYPAAWRMSSRRAIGFSGCFGWIQWMAVRSGSASYKCCNREKKVVKGISAATG